MTSPRRFRIDCIVGARPNFVKIAPIMRALAERPDVSARLIHTGQHYDFLMNAAFFEELRIPAPDVNLEIGSGTNTQQTARIMLALEPALGEARPDLLMLVGDVNSTLAATLVAAKLGIPVAHVEAGLRSFDATMPEEINRLVTDRLSDLLFATEPAGVENLAREGADPARVALVGNVMIDSLFACLDRAVAPARTFADLGVSPEFRAAVDERGFGVVTLHRPSNVDDPAQLGALMDALARIARKLPLVFPIHPRTRATIAAHGLAARLEGAPVAISEPLTYLRLIGLMRAARFVATDSGGIQEETTALGVPCLTIRDNTERPVTITEGTNLLIGRDPALLTAAVDDILAGRGKRGAAPALWDGRAAQRIAERTAAFLAAR